MTADLADAAFPATRTLCRRGLHPDVPENVYREPGRGQRRCLGCKRAGAGGQTGTSPYVVSTPDGSVTSVHGRPRPGPLGDLELDRLRALVACPGCGRAPREVLTRRGSRIATQHPPGCPVARTGDGAP